MEKRIDDKHSIAILDGELVVAKRLPNGDLQPIPPEEPTILFRGRDKLAVRMLLFYRQLCKEDGCSNYQLATMDNMISKFQEFAHTSPTMKQPGLTKGY